MLSFDTKTYFQTLKIRKKRDFQTRYSSKCLPQIIVFSDAAGMGPGRDLITWTALLYQSIHPITRNQTQIKKSDFINLSSGNLYGVIRRNKELGIGEEQIRASAWAELVPFYHSLQLIENCFPKMPCHIIFHSDCEGAIELLWSYKEKLISNNEFAQKHNSIATLKQLPNTPVSIDLKDLSIHLINAFKRHSVTLVSVSDKNPWIKNCDSITKQMQTYYSENAVNNAYFYVDKLPPQLNLMLDK